MTTYTVTEAAVQSVREWIDGLHPSHYEVAVCGLRLLGLPLEAPAEAADPCAGCKWNKPTVIWACLACTRNPQRKDNYEKPKGPMP